MAREGDKWRVVKGDCLWDIAEAVYGNGRRWTEIADANGIKRSSGIIYPNQLLILPNITSTASPAPPATVNSQVSFEWFALDAGTDRAMYATWYHEQANTEGYEVTWEWNTGEGGWRSNGTQTVQVKQSSWTAPNDAKSVRVTVKPVSSSYTGVAVSREYNFSNNPPGLPPNPEFEISVTNVLTVVLNNIDEHINADSIEFAIYQDDIYKWKTAKVQIYADPRHARYTCEVEEGHRYKIRCRAVRGSIYGGYTDFTDNDYAVPIAPTAITTLRSQVISEQMSRTYGIFVEWDEVESAVTYVVQWATDPELFDTGEAHSQNTEEGQGPRILITGIELGHKYYFRVGSVNTKGTSRTYTPIESVVLGSRPSAPTTYSNTVSAVLGEDLNLYWVHNSTDGSIETYARLNLEITDSAHPSLPPTIITKVIENTRPEEEKDKTSVYTINTDDPEWATVGEGFIIKWKVQTAGVISEYSEWSIEREVNVYAPPEVEIDLWNNQSISVEEINNFPFYFSVQSGPAAQTPISYYVEVISEDTYQTVDEVGKIKMVNTGDKIYQRFYDPQTNPWRFLLEMTPGNIDLENNKTYTVNVTVSMNSGLIATASKTFLVYLNDLYYDVSADVVFNKNTYDATIRPYCYEYDDNEQMVLVQDCTLAVYRREYDGSFIEIAKDIPNGEGWTVVDPHPSLDYARYRVVARMNDTGAISYSDIPAVKIGITSIIMQWSEEWIPFQVDEQGTGNVEPDWSGSMLILPYNVEVSEDRGVEVTLIDYAGRERPVSYFGSHISESATWNTDVPKDDKETLYGIRRLSTYHGNVYVREPSGTGYWAAMSISYNLKYSSLVVPVTFTIRRVEGGI